jgi:glycerol-3-phosphate dehydrogenase
MAAFSWKERQTAIDTCKTRSTELLIIGGGVVGSSIAAHASLLGLDCVLIEKEDFAAGTSGNSTGLAHAGLRYLAQGRIGYVFKEARERLMLEKIAPHWVQPFPFLFPVYKGDPYGVTGIRLGTWIYDWLYRLASLGMGSHIGQPHRMTTSAELLERIPGLDARGLKGGAEYFVDARLTDSRFTLGFAQKAGEFGTRVINHASLISFTEKDGQLSGAVVRDEITQTLFPVQARLIINASGPWIDGIRQLVGLTEPVLQNSKGIHLIVDRVAEYPLIFAGAARGQVFFVIPIGRHLTLVGTTDTPHADSPDDAKPASADIHMLLKQLFRYFPKIKPTADSDEAAVRRYEKDHVHEAYWGVRPLLRQGGSTLKASREHKLLKEAKGLWSIPGVKLTAGRAVGQEVAREAWNVLRGNTPPGRTLVALPGGEFGDFRSYVMQARNKMGVYSDDHLKYLIGRYGSLYEEVLRWADREPGYRDKVLSDEQWMYAEAAYAANYEMVLTLNDFLWRRVRWARLRDLPDAAVARIAEILAHHLKWSKSEMQRQVESFKKQLKTHRLHEERTRAR